MRYVLDGRVSREGWSVSLWRGFREIVVIDYERNGITQRFDGERIGERWEGVHVSVPLAIDEPDRSAIVAALQTAFEDLQLDYLIRQVGAPVPVSDDEKKAAISELLSMGIVAELSTDGSEIRTSRVPGSGVPSRKEASLIAQRLPALLEAVSGKRRSITVLAQSKEFS
jgi:hypothetical protein